MCILMNSASSSSDCDDDCAELSANLCEKEQTDIVQSHIRETTDSDLQREKPVLAAVHGVDVNGTPWRRTSERVTKTRISCFELNTSLKQQFCEANALSLA